MGASTDSFGAIGILAARQFVQRRRAGPSRGKPWMAVAADLALLGLTGTGSRSDFLAHLFGLVSGLARGGIPTLAVRRPPSPLAQWRLLLAAGRGGVPVPFVRADRRETGRRSQPIGVRGGRRASVICSRRPDRDAFARDNWSRRQARECQREAIRGLRGLWRPAELGRRVQGGVPLARTGGGA